MPRLRSPRSCPLRVLALLTSLTLFGCQEPPGSQERVPPPVHRDDESAKELKAAAYGDAFTQAIEPARSALMLADPLAAYQAGLAPAASPALRRMKRVAMRKAVDPVQDALNEVAEGYLPGPEIVILRALRFSFARLNDDLRRRSPSRQDPMEGLRAITTTLDEFRYRLLQDDCDASCMKLPAALALDVAALRVRLSESSNAGMAQAKVSAAALTTEVRALADTSLIDDRSGLDALARALDEHQGWLAAAHEALPDATVHPWTAPAVDREAAAPESLARLPDILGAAALSRRLSVEERLDLFPAQAFAEVERHVERWLALRESLLAGRELGEDPPLPLDLARCQAAHDRLSQALAAIDTIDGPQLDCARYLALVGEAPRSEAQLVLDLLDAGVIEPQRRALRAKELPELALITGAYSSAVHIHLRRIMILALLREDQASAAAIDEGRKALCLAAGSLWIHAQLGPASEVSLTLGKACADLGDAATITARVLGDPRASLAGYGLSLIGDEPARMVGFDRFFWAPLGLMKVLATPQGMHPDNFTLPDDPAPRPAPEVELKVEKL